jgi:hypothetical protein
MYSLFNIIQLSEVDIMKTKTIKTPLMMAVAFGPTSCPSGLVSKSKLLHSPEVQSGFVPKLSLHGGKNLVTLSFTKKSASSARSARD